MQIIAHRGASGSAPENTMAAFQRAFELGADGIELDVRLSGDGEIVVHHDATTGRLTDADVAVAKTTAAELQALNVAGSNCGIPRLADVLVEIPPGKRALIEIKSGPKTVAALRRTLARLGQATLQRLRLDVISFNLDALLACREVLPELHCYPVFSLADNDSRYPYDADQWIALAARHGFAGLDPDHRDIDAKLAEATRNASLELITWTVNEPAQAQRMQSLGVSAIATDWPGKIREQLHRPTPMN